MKDRTWTLILKPQHSFFDLRLEELWSYRDLVALWVRRDFVALYKQTVLGPLWYIIQPLTTSVVFTVVFGSFAKFSTDETPPFLFYMTGNILWLYFSETITRTAETFTANASIFGKVYFPRLAMPISAVASNLIQFGIQFVFLGGFYAYYWLQGASVQPSLWAAAILPLLVLQTAALSFAVGIAVSSLTTKYRDLRHALRFGIQLWMYASPIVYPASSVPLEYRDLFMLNPIAPVLEAVRYVILGSGTFEFHHILTSVAITFLLCLVSILVFNRVERNFLDTV